MKTRQGLYVLLVVSFLPLSLSTQAAEGQIREKGITDRTYTVTPEDPAGKGKKPKVTYQGVLDMLNSCTLIGRNVFPDEAASCDDVCGSVGQTCIYAGAHEMGAFNYATYRCNYLLYDTQNGVSLNCLCCSPPP
jgi:hypothetical protein